MSRKDFDEACNGLRAAGCRVGTAEYDEEAFGNWFVDFRSPEEHRYRAIWEARDCWLILQKDVAGAFTDCWIGRDRNQHNVNALLGALSETIRPEDDQDSGRALSFVIDRMNLPKRWANPLVFTLCAADLTIEARIEQNAAIEYQTARLGSGAAEAFLDEIESAVSRLHAAGEIASPTIILTWGDLHPATTDRFKP